MSIRKTVLLYFSPTHTTQRVVHAIGEGAGYPVEEIDLTLPGGRGPVAPFDKDTLVVVGVPVYGGQLPSLLRPFLETLRGDGTPAVVVSVYGNRHYEECPKQLFDLLATGGFVPVAAGVFVGEHSFSQRIAQGRPNEADLARAVAFGQAVRGKLKSGCTALEADLVPLRAIDRETVGAHQSKMKQAPAFGPTVSDACTLCGDCAAACPTAAINPDNPRDIKGEACIKCRACARACPMKAIDFTQPPFLALVENCVKGFGSPDAQIVTAL